MANEGHHLYWSEFAQHSRSIDPEHCDSRPRSLFRRRHERSFQAGNAGKYLSGLSGAAHLHQEGLVLPQDANISGVTPSKLTCKFLRPIVHLVSGGSGLSAFPERIAQ